MAALSLYHPASEANPARARWKFVQRRINDGSFFVLSHEMTPFGFDKPTTHASSYASKGSKRQSVSFDHILSRAVSSVSKTPGTRIPRDGNPKSRHDGRRHQNQGRGVGRDAIPPVPTRPLRLADAHTARAVASASSTSFEDQSILKAANRMSRFMTGRMKDLRRLSKNFNTLSLEHAMAQYGPPTQYDEESSESGSSVGPLAEIPQPRRDQQRSGSRHGALERLAGSQSGGASAYAKSVLRQGSSGESESGRTERSARTVMSRSELQAATFSRKLSVVQATGGGSSHSRDAPPMPSHW